MLPSYIGIWDTKPPKGHTPSVEEARQKDNPLSVSTMFKHLDLTWKPTLKVCLHYMLCNFLTKRSLSKYCLRSFNHSLILSYPLGKTKSTCAFECVGPKLLNSLLLWNSLPQVP